MKNVIVVCTGLFLTLLIGCQNGNDNGNPTDPNTDAAGEPLGKSEGPKAVYTMSNATSGNSIIAFRRDGNGSLTSAGSFSTGGLGSGGGLGNQGALIRNGRWLFAVNAGSNEVSVLKSEGDGLTLVSKVSSGGVRPVSVTVHDNLVYVLNAGGTGNISGFTLASNGTLTPLAGSTRPLSSSAAGAAQIEFTPSGNGLIVTEKATNIIDSYAVGANGIASGPLSQPSVGSTPFGFAFNKSGDLIVSDAFGGAAGQSALTSYRVGESGGITLITGPVGNGQAAACWVVVTKNGKYAYTTNTASGNISSYDVAHDGGLTLNEAIAANTGAGSAPIDMALSNDSQFLYVLNSGAHTVSIFRVNNGSGVLTSVATVGGIPAGANGLAAR